LIWLIFFRPQEFGGKTAYVIVDGPSMEPTLHDNDLVIVRERGSYEIGDVIAFRLPDVGPEGAVIHRIVGGNADEGFVTRGDNRELEDNWRVMPEDILGRYVTRVPRIGLVIDWLARPLVIGLLVGSALATLYWTFRIHRQRPEPAPARTTYPMPPAGAPPLSTNGQRPVVRPVPPAPPAPAAPAPVAVSPGAAPEPSVAAHDEVAPTPSSDAESEGAVDISEPVAVPAMNAPWPDADPGGHDEVATRIRERFERADLETRLKIRQLVFEQAMAFKAQDPDFDTAAFLRACGAHAYDVHH
jgi:signal peptidase I